MVRTQLQAGQQMEQHNKLAQAISSGFLSGAAATWSWLQPYASAAATCVAIVAGCFSIWAARETIRVRRRQRRDLGDLKDD